MNLTFSCAICGDTFPADPDTMLEVKTGVALINDKEVPMEFKILANDHEYNLTGTYGICICRKCQKDITDDSPKVS